MQAQLCASPILVSVEELQKAVAQITQEKVNPQEPPSQTAIDTIGTTRGEEIKEQSGQISASVTTAQSPGALPQITIVDQISRQEEKDKVETPKEQEAIQALVTLPTSGTPHKQQKDESMPLQMSAPGSSSTRVTRILHYGDPELDEEIVIPSYDMKTISLEQIT